MDLVGHGVNATKNTTTASCSGWLCLFTTTTPTTATAAPIGELLSETTKTPPTTETTG